MEHFTIAESADREHLFVIHNRTPLFVVAFSDVDDGSFAAHQVVGLDGVSEGERRRLVEAATSKLRAGRT